LTASPIAPVQPRPPVASHLSAEEVEALGRELDAIRQRVLDSRGARDAAYIRRVIATQRALELGSRVVLLAGSRRSAWWLGTASLSLAKVLENMEIGHNVLHGQWDWMRDPKIHSTTWTWDHASPPDQWQRAHNEVHHRFTNIVGHDNDLGYGVMRVTEEQEWKPIHLTQPLLNALMACVFEWSIAMYDADLGDSFDAKRGLSDEARGRLRRTLRRAGEQVAKDYLVHPVAVGALSRGGFGRTVAANAVANLVRNVWSHSVIMCGHFPEGVETFELDELDIDESRGEWYLRQMLGSADISGSRAMHLMTGNLSHQIEHHLFPDLPSNRYAEVAPQVQEVFERYGLSYCARPFVPQVASAWHRVLRLSFPDGWLEETHRGNVVPQVRALGRRVRSARREAKADKARTRLKAVPDAVAG